MSSDALVKVEGVSKKFSSKLKTSMKYGIIDITRDFIGTPSQSETLRPDEFWSVQDVSFEVRRGECLGLIGPNGAGKSTLLKMLNGIILPDKGSIEINGRVGALIEVGAGFHPLLTGRENIYINGSIMGLRKKEIDQKFDSIVDFAELGDFIDTPVGYYSSGMYIRLGFAIAAHLQPDILLVDEILAVGDAGFQRKCLKQIKKNLSNGGCVVLVTHNILHVHSMSNTCIVLDDGHMSYYGASNKAAEIYYKATTKYPGSSPVRQLSSVDEMRYGAGDVQLVELSFEIKDEKSLYGNYDNYTLIAGKQATIKILIEANVNVERFHVGVGIWELTDLPLLTMNSQIVNQEIPMLAKNDAISINFDFICPLSSGLYKISAGIYSSKDEIFFDRRLNWKTLRVIDFGEQFGLLKIPYKLSILKNKKIITKEI
jgi:lipopolysaccharide transport system ATP-binding protein